MLIEQSFSDFGDADAVLLFNDGQTKQSILFEAKVKTSLKKTWSIIEEFGRFMKGINGRRVSSSDLFMQLYLKQALMGALQNMEIARLQSEGMRFPEWSSKRIRKLGNNEVIIRAAEALKSHSLKAHFIAIVPDETKRVYRFFQQELRKYRPDGCEHWDTEYWGFITWSEVEGFCRKNNLKDTFEVFEHNKGQIY